MASGGVLSDSEPTAPRIPLATVALVTNARRRHFRRATHTPASRAQRRNNRLGRALERNDRRHRGNAAHWRPGGSADMAEALALRAIHGDEESRQEWREIVSDLRQDPSLRELAGVVLQICADVDSKILHTWSPRLASALRDYGESKARASGTRSRSTKPADWAPPESPQHRARTLTAAPAAPPVFRCVTFAA